MRRAINRRRSAADGRKRRRVRGARVADVVDSHPRRRREVIIVVVVARQNSRFAGSRDGDSSSGTDGEGSAQNGGRVHGG